MSRTKAPKQPDDERLVYGLQPVREVIRVRPTQVRQVLVDPKADKRLEGLQRLASDAGLTVTKAPRARLDQLTRNGRHQGVVARADALSVHGELEALNPGPGALFVVLDKITDPQNFGALIRSTVALGSGVVIWGENGSAPLSPATFRASAGAIEHATLCRMRNLRSAVTDLGHQGVQTIALDANATTELSELDLTRPTAIVVGAEDRGVSRGVRQQCTHSAKLPMRGQLDSLNASVASAVALYEVLRQRQKNS